MGNPCLYDHPYQSPQLPLWEPSEVEWYVIIRDSPPVRRRKPRGRIVLIQPPRWANDALGSFHLSTCHRQTDLLLVFVDMQDQNLDLLTDGNHLTRMGDFGKAQLTCVDQSIYPSFIIFSRKSFGASTSQSEPQPRIQFSISSVSPICAVHSHPSAVSIICCDGCQSVSLTRFVTQ